MLIDYDKLVSDFKRLAENNTLSQAYLFFGCEEENQQKKFLFAQSLANFLENKIFEAPVRLLRESLIIAPDQKGTIGIASIRALKYFLWQKPTNSFRRTVIIKEAQSLTPEAQNAALKIVEEPPESALIIFIADNEDNLFPVLTSRLQKIYFPHSFRLAPETAIKLDSLSRLENLSDSGLEETEVSRFFEDLIGNLRKAPVKNFQQLKAALNRLTLMKQFNTNKRLQLRALISSISR